MNWKNIELVTQNVKAFVYVITINKDGEDKWYIGYKTIRAGWKEYISQSKYVKADKEFITSKVILEVFDTKSDAIAREEELLTKLNAVKSEKYYNRCNAGRKFNNVGLTPTEKQLSTAIANLSKINSNPDFKAKSRQASVLNMAKINSNPEIKAKRSAVARLTMTRLQQDPEFKAKSIAAAKKLGSDPITKSNREERMAKLNADPEFKAKSIAAARINNAKQRLDPEFMAKLRAASTSTMNKLHTDPEFKAKQKARSREVNSKKVINLETGIVYFSIREAAYLQGSKSFTISEHCHNRVKIPKWQFTN